MIKAIAIDDEPPALKVITNFCAKTEFVDLVKTFTDTTAAFNYLKNFPVDLIFLDIKMPAISGIDFYKSISQSTMVVFTTAYSDYAVEGFNLNATDYLLKPFTYDRFLQAATKAKDYAEYIKGTSAPVENRVLMVRADYSLHQINFADIIYIESLDDYLRIHIEGKKNVVVRMTMKTMMEKLPAPEFIRVHRSFIIPFARINKVRGKQIYIGETEIPLSQNYQQAFFDAYGM